MKAEGETKRRLRISDFSQSIEGSKTLAITTRVAELRRQGREIIDLGAGEPDFPTPAPVCQAGIKAIEQGFTKYTPNAGIYALRERIATFINSHGGDYEPEQILVCSGAKHAIYNALLATCDPGDEVLLPVPYWTSYPEQVKLAGAKPVLLSTSEANGFKITARQLRAAIGAKTRMLILNSPSNPTGAVYSESELSELVEVIVDAGIFVLSDEIYMMLVYDGRKPLSLAQFESVRAQLLLINGLSKSHAMTGWRVGYLAADPGVIKAAAKIQSHTTSNISSISQYAALAALALPETAIVEMRRAFEERRDFVIDALRRIKGIEISRPAGAFYVFPNIKAHLGKKFKQKTMNSTMDLADFLLEQAGVALVPGEAFGSSENIRISYANSLDNLKLAISHIEQALQLLH